MTAKEFIASQDRIGCTGTRLAEWLGIQPLTVTRYRMGTTKVPGPVAVSMKALETGWRP
jgi:hypothetical protein